jgi:hypothetical protein
LFRAREGKVERPAEVAPRVPPCPPARASGIPVLEAERGS